MDKQTFFKLFDLLIPNSYTISMISKENAIKTIQDIPDSVTWADIIEERIRFLSSIDKEIDEIRYDTISQQEEVKESLKQLLSK